MALGVSVLPTTVAPSSLVKGHEENSWAGPADQAAQCLVSMSSISQLSNISNDSSSSKDSSVATAASTAPASTSSTAASPPPPLRLVRAPHSKPNRLSLACDTCRKRKVRCDARQPKCRNCLRRGDVCVTSDPRRPDELVPARQKTTRRHTGPPAILSEHRLLQREAQQHGERNLLVQSRRNSLSGHAVDASNDSDYEFQNEQQDEEGRVFSPDLNANLNDHTPLRPRMPSYTSSFEASFPLASEQQHHEPERAQFLSHFSHPLPHSQQPLRPQQLLLQTLPVDITSGGSPASVGSSTNTYNSSVELVRLSSAAKQVRNRNRNNSSSNNGGDMQLPTWVSRAYKAASAEQAPNLHKAQPDSHQGQEERQQQEHHPDAATPDVVINTDGSPNRFKAWGGSSLQYLFKFTDVCLAGYGFDATAPLFRHGMTQSDEFDMPLLPSLPNLPSRSTVTHCIRVFIDRIWPIFPVIDREAVKVDADFLLGLQAEDSDGRMHGSSLQCRLQASHVPNLVILYAIVCVGLSETSSTDPVLTSLLSSAASYLTACYSLHAHLTALPYQSSVQALFLLALSLRACGKDGQSWYILGLTLRLAMSLGLHKKVEGPQQGSSSLQRRLWWSCFSLERLLQLECGRPSSIDSTHDYGSVDSNLSIRLPGFGQWHPKHSLSRSSCEAHDSQERSPPIIDVEHEGEERGDQHDAHRLFTAWVALSAIMGQISDRFYNHRFGHAIELLGETARLVQCLKKWEADLPESIKPQSSSHGANFGPDEVAVAFLAQQFYHSKMAVLRIAILFPQQSFQKEVQKRSLELAEIRQLTGAASQCVSAARSLITLTLQLADAGVHSTLIGVQQTFLASIVLALGILRGPRSRLVGSDVELLTEATSYVEGCYKAWGYPPAYLAILSRLRERTAAVSRGQVQLLGPSGAPNGSHAFRVEGGTKGSSTFASQTLANKVAAPPRHVEGQRSCEQAQEATCEVIARHEGVMAAPPLTAYANTIDPSSSILAALTSEAGMAGMEGFISMDFDNFWDMLKADIFT